MTLDRPRGPVIRLKDGSPIQPQASRWRWHDPSHRAMFVGDICELVLDTGHVLAAHLREAKDGSLWLVEYQPRF